MPKLTKRFVESVKPALEDQVIFDHNIPGFGLRVLSSGVRSYLVQTATNRAAPAGSRSASTARLRLTRRESLHCASSTRYAAARTQ